jgi:hypothetical protein
LVLDGVVELELTQVKLRGILTGSVIIDSVELLCFAPLESVACPRAQPDLGPIDTTPPQPRTVDQAKVSGVACHCLAVKAAADMISLPFGHEDILNQVAHPLVRYLLLNLVDEGTVLCELLAFRAGRPWGVVPDFAEVWTRRCGHKQNNHQTLWVVFTDQLRDHVGVIL